MGCILKGGGGLYSRVAVGAVLLAAGSGSRMGHRPKSLLELGGVPLIRRQLIALSGAGVDEVVVVLGHYAERIEEAVKEFPVTLVRNPDPDAGQISSLRLGLQALSPKLDAVLVALADQPLINSQDINDLIGAYKKRPGGMQVVQPTVDGLPGNPVMFSTEVREQI
ncbi:MAG: nucleotidyltransferase family protein, partial [Limnohabitans sp.]|nr:nucleotidyltransferase family protein [Limnohabitans sp.]